jgi:hypothetical protein
MSIGQKAAVIQEVLKLLPNFTLNQDIALNELSSSSLETIKNAIALRIMNGEVEYSKDSSNSKEVKAYARSMVMNHMKKARELNGGSASSVVKKTETQKATSDIVKKTKQISDSMPSISEELKDFVNSLSL